MPAWGGCSGGVSRPKRAEALAQRLAGLLLVRPEAPCP